MLIRSLEECKTLLVPNNDQSFECRLSNTARTLTVYISSSRFCMINQYLQQSQKMPTQDLNQRPWTYLR